VTAYWLHPDVAVYGKANLNERLEQRSGRTVALGIVRDGKTITKSVVLGQ